MRATDPCVSSSPSGLGHQSRGPVNLPTRNPRNVFPHQGPAFAVLTGAEAITFEKQNRRPMSDDLRKEAPMPQELELTNRTFSDEVLRSDAPVLVDFWAPWCGPCRAMMPVIDKLAKESGGRYRVGKVNVDHFPDIAKYYGISGVPTLLLFHRGRVVKAFEGVQSERTLRAALDKVSPPAANPNPSPSPSSNFVMRWLGLE